jgi:PhnB protein
MASRLNPYINLDGTAREALEHYQRIFGGSLAISTFGEYGGGGPDADKVMHGQLETDAGYTLMVSDTTSDMSLTVGSNISVSLSGEDAEDLHRYWTGLCEGGTVTMPLATQMWGDEFGMCVDRFGVPWMVNITPPAA